MFQPGEDEDEVSVEGDHDANVQELKARREELRLSCVSLLAARVLEKNKTHSIEMEVRPIFLIPDTNCFIDHLPSLQKLISYLLSGKPDNDDHRHKTKNAHLKALTSKGTVMETIAFRSEETDSSVCWFCC
ncbi:hypothetical protein DPMN_008239 [Dreissena polymorpha]|uniref:PIN domain-containing protein n=1 Tax=Dreissena polymorpha TaxID=45954 RepID=A0A9D4MZZ9_DREPO|nr:hypothetical protein DPMN_008239 [Dreissena polymorpha]